jgi:polysaccharide export outer membrane protein
MSKWVYCASCLLLVVFTETVLTVSAQKLPAPPAASRAETFGDGEYRVGPEDIIEIAVWRDENLSKTAVIRPDGKITLNMIGEIVASKKTARELEQEIHTALAKFIDPPPQVNVTVKEIHSPKISVLGFVTKPGVYVIKQKTTVLGAISQAGGFSEWADQENVVLIRDGKSGPEQFKLNLKSMLKGEKETKGNKPTIFYVEPGDTIYVHED